MARRNSTGGAPGDFRTTDAAAGAPANIGARAVERQGNCLRDASAESLRCQSLGVLAAFAQVSAVDIAKCTKPDVIDARNQLLTLLDDLDAVWRGEAERVPRVPPTPRCG